MCLRSEFSLAARRSLEQLAEAAGMNPLQFGHIERGASDVKLSTIVKLAHALGTTASELLRSIR